MISRKKQTRKTKLAQDLIVALPLNAMAFTTTIARGTEPLHTFSTPLLLPFDRNTLLTENALLVSRPVI